MRIAVTTHAVIRYKERVPGADCMEDETVRDIIREKVDLGFKDGLVRDHPTERDRRIIPFKAGQSILYFSIGPNKSVTIQADLAVIGVLYDKDLGKVEMGPTLGDALPELKDIQVESKGHPRFIVQIGSADSVESYRVQDGEELKALLLRRRPNPGDVLLYEFQDVEISAEYVVQKK